MRRFLRDNSLSLCFGFLFLAALTGQAVAGHRLYNEEGMQHGNDPTGLGRYLSSSAFGQAVMENWQSEYLQFTLYILLTVWLVQRGSSESKEVEKAGRESDEDQLVGGHANSKSPRWARSGGLRTLIFSNSLVLLMAVIFLGSWLGQSLTSWNEFNSEQFDHGERSVTWLRYLGSSDFWEATLQNWQSEFLAIGSMAVFSIYLRQRGSPESKPVGRAHADTGIGG